ncbi:FAD-binding PCMH-type domain-containing protein [Mycena indigotica]|uniref:FAD-binding PCMH-type domain-containing protein n=1 Tax=Mycena indigotica TaxID=2126181 RepID=A0A8H6T480_9AGAR|nr:FAD-binding PCMH-type domain-containing protein [Mycena indigotica]KAF7311780.1 FAD-binding PCMH-type domain-containing protein [Mycena indigotica]
MALLLATSLASLHLLAGATLAAVDVCGQINLGTSPATKVYYPVDLLGNYAADLSHWASSSSDLSACTVEPANAADVGTILTLIGSARVPFAVKGGGHTANPGFSSTPGVHISMTKFSDVVYDAPSQTVRIGAGLVWDDFKVYAALDPLGVNVVGGRVSGVGVAGFTLGGGYSWKTNQYGLTVDTITAYKLVKPSGAVVTVTQASDPELFFALKGGGNNFGIVTDFTLKTFPQTQVWGGLITYTADKLPAVANAVAAFAANVTDPKAAIIPAVNFLATQPGVSHIMFYDGPTAPSGIFDDFLAIPHFTKDVKTRSFLDLVQSAPSDATSGTRGAFHTVGLRSYSKTMIDAIINETIYWGAALTLAGAAFVSYDIEPFLPSIYTHGTLPKAFPFTAEPFIPLNLYYAWAPSLTDGFFHDALRASAAHLTQVALADGQTGVDTAPLYPNYALIGTPLSRIYGSNLATMQAVKAIVDPTNVMGLAGGWKI